MVTLPCEANYTGHRAELTRRAQTKRWLAEREHRLQQLKSPPLVPQSDHRARGVTHRRLQSAGR
jgi:hypothetical protein